MRLPSAHETAHPDRLPAIATTGLPSLSLQTACPWTKHATPHGAPLLSPPPATPPPGPPFASRTAVILPPPSLSPRNGCTPGVPLARFEGCTPLAPLGRPLGKEPGPLGGSDSWPGEAELAPNGVKGGASNSTVQEICRGTPIPLSLLPLAPGPPPVCQLDAVHPPWACTRMRRQHPDAGMTSSGHWPAWALTSACA